jgi:hypothetical protein
VIPAGSSLAAEPVFDYEMPVLDADLESVAVGDSDPAASTPVGLAIWPAKP